MGGSFAAAFLPNNLLTERKALYGGYGMKAARRIAAAAYPPYWYLDEHGRPFKFIFASTFALICEDIASGRADATVSTARDFERWNKEYDAHGTAKDPRRGADIGLTEAAIRAYQR